MIPISYVVMKKVWLSWIKHVAQERYHYEQLNEKLLVQCTNKQPLMVPIQLDVSSNVLAQYMTINEKQSILWD